MTDDRDFRELPSRRRRALLATLAGATSAGLAGCGGRSGDDATDTTDTGDDGTAASTTEATAGAMADPPSEVELAPFWTTGEKYGVGTVADHTADEPSRVWFTLTEGALTEPRFPRVDLMQFRAVDFLVADGAGYVARGHNRDRRDDDPVERRVAPVADDALLYRHELADPDRGWSLTAEYAADPAGDALLVDTEFDAPDDLTLYLVARPALSGAVANDRGVRVEGRGGTALAVVDAEGRGDIRDTEDERYEIAAGIAAADGFEWATVGGVESETATQLLGNGVATDAGTEETGNLVLAGTLGSGSLSTTVALGFVEQATPEAAVAAAEASLSRGYEAVRADYVDSWRDFLDGVDTPDSVAGDDALHGQYNTAAMTLRAVEDKTFHGAGIASPSVPWGKGIPAGEPRDVGYNFVWSRDLYQAFTALEAMGQTDAAIAATEYLLTVQQDDGGFLPQNTYLDGRTRWGGEQLDNVAFPLVMAYQLAERHGYGLSSAGYGYTNIKASADYVARSGPETAQERWEEESGFSPSTIAAEIAGLACAARLAEDRGERADALAWLGLADRWRAGVAEWCATTTGPHAEEPYYIRVSEDRDPDDGNERGLANGGPTLDEREIVDAGFLELVRLGIVDADDDLIRSSLAVVDETIRVDTPNGPAWYRYVGDGYGEGERGAPWSTAPNTVGRLWPIFTGERAEYELRAGTAEGALAPTALLRTMARFANEGRMIPEQVWDRSEPTKYGWEFGEGTGSATPLSWSMAQFVRLAHGIDAGEPAELPAFVRARYAGGAPDAPSLDAQLPDPVVDSETVTVSGTTDAAEVVVHTTAGTVSTTPTDGEFSVDVPLVTGKNVVTVVAGTVDGSLADARVATARGRVTVSAS